MQLQGIEQQNFTPIIEMFLGKLMWLLGASQIYFKLQLKTKPYFSTA